MFLEGKERKRRADGSHCRRKKVGRPDLDARFLAKAAPDFFDVCNEVDSAFDAYNEENAEDSLREGNALYRRDGESTEIGQSHQRKVLKENDSGAYICHILA